MKGNVRLQISTPCHEDWNRMRPEERGRFCAACSKVVVDFSMMTDQEVVQYLAQAGSAVCGRVMPEQLDRNMALPGVAGPRRRSWWHWLVAGLLVTGEAKAQAPGKTKKELVGMGIATKYSDTVEVQVLPEVTVVGYEVKKKNDITGEVTCIKKGDTEAEQGLYGPVGGLIYRVTISSLEDRVTDTLAAMGLLPKPELRVYPNPARRGGVVTLDWRRTEAGQYEVGLYNAAGSLVEQHIMEVGGKGQVNLIALPPALPAGMYLLRAALPYDAKKVITLKIIVL